jgi:hypothetical protein
MPLGVTFPHACCLAATRRSLGQCNRVWDLVILRFLVVAEPAVVGRPSANAFEVHGRAPVSTAYLRDCSCQAVPCSVQAGLLRGGRGAYGSFLPSLLF